MTLPPTATAAAVSTASQTVSQRRAWQHVDAQGAPPPPRPTAADRGCGPRPRRRRCPKATKGVASQICRRATPPTPPRVKLTTARARSQESWARLVTKPPSARNSDDRMNPVSRRLRLSLRWRTKASSRSSASWAPGQAAQRQQHGGADVGQVAQRGEGDEGQQGDLAAQHGPAGGAEDRGADQRVAEQPLGDDARPPPAPRRPGRRPPAGWRAARAGWRAGPGRPRSPAPTSRPAAASGQQQAGEGAGTARRAAATHGASRTRGGAGASRWPGWPRRSPPGWWSRRAAGRRRARGAAVFAASST